MVRDGLFSFRCVCRLELERSGCVRRGPPAGAGAPPSGGRYGRARKGGPHRLDIGSKRVPPLGWARARSLPRALRARAPLLLDSAGCASIILLFTVSRAHRDAPPSDPSLHWYSFTGKVFISTPEDTGPAYTRTHLATPTFTDRRATGDRHYENRGTGLRHNHVQTRTSSASRQARAIPTRTWCRR